MKRCDEGPPRLLENALEVFAPEEAKAELVEDLRELFALRRETKGEREALLWYGCQVLSFAWRFRSDRRKDRQKRRRSPEVATFLQDATYGLRTLLRSAGFTMAALLTLTLGIGANVAIWSVLHHVVLRPLGHPDEDRIVQIWPEHRFTRRQYEQYRTRVRSFETVSAFVRTSFTLTGETTPEVVRGALVTSEHFGLFSRSPVRGRDFESSDSLPGAEPVALVSYEMWQNRFGGRENILGTRIELGGLEGATRTIVGVSSPAFLPFAEVVDVWAPIELDPDAETYTHVANLGMVGRLLPGVERETARAELQAIAEGLVPTPSYVEKVPAYRIAPLRAVLVERIEPTLLALLGAVAIVLLLCCFNVANLLLARSSFREREIRVRIALGASRFRIARQLFTENLVLAGIGGCLGLCLAWLGSSFFVKLVPPDVPRAESIGVDVPVALFAIFLSLATSVLFGWLPVLRLTGASGLTSRASGTSLDRSRIHRLLVTAEIALSLALVIASGLLVKSFFRLQRVDAGFPSDGLVTMKLLPSTVRYQDDADLYRYYHEVLESVRAVPGVVSTGAIQLLPMTARFMGVHFSPTGEPIPKGVDPPSLSYRIVTPDYRRALGARLLAGRDLTDDDRRGTEPVGLINETFAREVWPNEDAIGKRVRYEDGSLWFTVVGVMSDVHQHRLDLASEKEVYVPHAQDSWPNEMFVLVRHEGEARTAMASLRDAIWSVDPDVPIREASTMDEIVRASMAEPRVRMLLFSGFAVLAFVLSAIGVYGVVAYTVSQRARDIGIRMALGATRHAVLRETLLTGMRPVGVGILLGLLLSLATSRLLDRFLFHVQPADPIVLTVVGASLAFLGLLAAYFPARRASTLDPVSSLNVES